MTTTRSMLPVLFVLLAACGSDRTESAPAHRSDVVAPAAAAPSQDPAPASPAARTEEHSSATVEPAPAAPAAPSDGSFAIVRATFTHGVEARRPVDEARAFAVGERATLHLVVKNLGAPRDVTIEWLRGESVLGRTTLSIGTSPAWRTWAFRGVSTRDVAEGIHARVVDEDGHVIHEAEARVTATPQV